MGVENNFTNNDFLQALKYCIIKKSASVSLLQRYFGFSYEKACSIIDDMEKREFVSESNGVNPRKVLLSLDSFIDMFGDITIEKVNQRKISVNPSKLQKELKIGYVEACRLADKMQSENT